MTRLARQVVVAAAAAALAAGCSRDATSTTPATSTSMPPIKTYLTQGPFDRTPDGQSVDLITLRNQAGIEVRIMTYGAIILSLKTPDRAGALDDIVLGFDTFAPYVDKSPYFGAVVGRYGNRIAKGKFTLDGTDVHARDEQRREPPARRQQGLRQDGVEGRARFRTRAASA